MKTFAVGLFKAKCLALIDDVNQTKEPIIITKHGKPKVKIIPYDSEKDMVQKPLKGAATYIGDVVSPLDEAWDAAQ
jgi:prevent-host-death family protein